MGQNTVSMKKAVADSMADDRPGSAIGKAFKLLEVLIAAEGSVALHALAERTGIPKPSAHRMLLQLEETGVVKRDLTGKRFVIGDTFADLAVKTVSSLTRTGAVRDIVAGLVERIGETCNLGILDGHQILYLERVECDQPLRVHLTAGSRVPLHATAIGKMVLAFAPADKRRRLLDAAPMPRLTERTLDREGILAQLPEIRATGVSINREESVIGLVGLGVPVFDGKGHFVAGLALHAPVSRFNDAAVNSAVPILKEGAKEIAATLPHAPDL